MTMNVLMMTMIIAEIKKNHYNPFDAFCVYFFSSPYTYSELLLYEMKNIGIVNMTVVKFIFFSYTFDIRLFFFFIILKMC